MFAHVHHAYMFRLFAHTRRHPLKPFRTGALLDLGHTRFGHQREQGAQNPAQQAFRVTPSLTDLTQIALHVIILAGLHTHTHRREHHIGQSGPFDVIVLPAYRSDGEFWTAVPHWEGWPVELWNIAAVRVSDRLMDKCARTIVLDTLGENNPKA